MRSNASISALFLLLTGCGGGAYSEAPPEMGLSPAAQAMPVYARRERGMEAPPTAQPVQAYQAPPGYDGPGTSYDRPGSVRPQQAYAPQPTYSPPPQDYADPTAGATGPSGSSRPAAGEVRYDEVGYAGVRGVEGGDTTAGAVVGVHRSLRAGSFVEVTSLETGRTILVLITGSLGGADHPIDLSPAAARLLGAGGSRLPVRVRKVTAPPPDQAALRAGQPASERFDAPPVLLNALRKQLPAAGFANRPVATPPSAGPGAPYIRPGAPARSGYYVQIAALSSQARAQALADSLGGFVRPGNGLYRVQIGPFATAGEAQSARSDVARRGYADARVFTQN